MDRTMLQVLAQEMGATPDRLRRVQQATTFEEAQQHLADLKADMKRGFRRLALKYHPDRNPNDPSAEAKFKVLTAILREAEGLQVQRRPAPVPMVCHIVMEEAHTRPGGPQVTNFASAYASVNSATTTATYDARRVVFIRVS